MGTRLHCVWNASTKPRVSICDIDNSLLGMQPWSSLGGLRRFNFHFIASIETQLRNDNALRKILQNSAYDSPDLSAQEDTMLVRDKDDLFHAPGPECNRDSSRQDKWVAFSCFGESLCV